LAVQKRNEGGVGETHVIWKQHEVFWSARNTVTGGRARGDERRTIGLAIYFRQAKENRPNWIQRGEEGGCKLKIKMRGKGRKKKAKKKKEEEEKKKIKEKKKKKRERKKRIIEGLYPARGVGDNSV